MVDAGSALQALIKMGKSKRKRQSKEPTPEFLEISPQEAEELRDRIRKKSLTPQDYQLLEGLINAFSWSSEYHIGLAELVRLIGQYKFKECLVVVEDLLTRLEDKT